MSKPEFSAKTFGMINKESAKASTPILYFPGGGVLSKKDFK